MDEIYFAPFRHPGRFFDSLANTNNRYSFPHGLRAVRNGFRPTIPGMTRIHFSLWWTPILCFGAFCLDVRTSTVCQLMRFAFNHEKSKLFAGEQKASECSKSPVILWIWSLPQPIFNPISLPDLVPDPLDAGRCAGL